jgi:choline dehydrogenase-like flavoprotein
MNAIYGLERLRIRKERYETVGGDVEEDVDVCVVGSGAGGAVMARKMCEYGRSVVVLEKGGYYDGEDMNQRDEDMIPLLWKNAGANFNDDLSVAIGQGECLGGSTVINDAVCFPIPEITRRQWRGLGVQISDAEWDTATEEVSREIHVAKVRDDELNRNNRMLRKGCEAMGFRVHYANSRNCIDCMQCGLCHLGCHYETKQDMRVTYLHRALNDQNSRIRIYCNCSAERLEHAGGTIGRVVGEFRDRDGRLAGKIRVRAKVVVLAAGAIASSQILLKNRIAPDRVGRGLALHPVAFVLGDFPYEIRANQGITMAYTLHEFGVTNGVEDGGFLIEAIFLPPLQFSLHVSISPEEHRELLGRYTHMTMAFAFPRDHPTGSIGLTPEGEPRVSYALDRKGIEDVAKGIEILARMWFKLGATRVVTSHRSEPILKSEDEIPRLIRTIKREPRKLFLVSAHPQGGNRMGSDPATSVVDATGRVHGFQNLFVSDASVFPNATGVNPQLTVMTLSTILSRRINESQFGSGPQG